MTHRQVILDTETTGLSASDGHRIIEIGCVELVNRRLTGRTLHLYLNPERDIDQGALEVHGLTREMLSDKPLFAHIADEFLVFIADSELLIHNAAFDVGFLDSELGRIDRQPTATHCLAVTDTLALARELHPGKRNSLDALCDRYGVSNAHRKLHGALLDAELLSEVYLAMTRGQESLEIVSVASGHDRNLRTDGGSWPPQDLPVVGATPAELAAHEAMLAAIAKESGKPPVWT